MRTCLLIILFFAPPEDTGAANGYDIQPVPKTTINLDEIPATPFNPEMLQLEIKGFTSREGKILAIGEVMRHDGFLFSSYPQYDLVARYSVDNRQTIFIGPQNHGGNTVPLKNPGQLRLINETLSITCRSNGQVFVTNLDGELINYDMIADFQNPFPAPSFPIDSESGKPRYLIINHHDNHLMKRINPRGRSIVSYGFGPDERTRQSDPMDWSFRGTGLVTENWEVIFISFSGTRLLHFDSKGSVIQRIFFESSGFKHSSSLPIRPGYETTPLPLDPIKGVQYDNGTYWVLLEINSHSHLLSVNGKEKKLFVLGKNWNGIHFEHPHLTLYDRHSGHIRSYKLK